MNKMFGIAIITVALTGCSSYATKEDLARTNADVHEIRVGAIEIGKKANKAYDLAKNAQERIDLLTETTATCCAENRARLDALFEKAMRK